MEDQSVETMDGPEEVEGPTAAPQNLPSRPSSPPNQQESCALPQCLAERTHTQAASRTLAFTVYVPPTAGLHDNL